MSDEEEWWRCHEERLRRRPLNSPGEVHYFASLWAGRGGNWEVYFDTLEEMDFYNSDPDRWAAKHFGFVSIEDYYEWVESRGVARCGATTRAGKPCKCVVALADNAEAWRRLHRIELCKTHSK